MGADVGEVTMVQRASSVVEFAAYVLGWLAAAALVTLLFGVITEGSLKEAIMKWPFFTWRGVAKYVVLGVVFASVMTGVRWLRQRHRRR